MYYGFFYYNNQVIPSRICIGELRFAYEVVLHTKPNKMHNLSITPCSKVQLNLIKNTGVSSDIKESKNIMYSLFSS